MITGARGERVRKHRNDYNHGKPGWVGGNPRYRRRYPLLARSMRPGGRTAGRYRGSDE